MLADQIVRANRTAVDLRGGAGVRDFAAREFPREDYHWVAAWLEPRPTPTTGGWLNRVRAWRLRRSPTKAEPDTELIREPAPA